MDSTIGPPNHYISPAFVAMLVTGIVFCAAFPPLGVAIILFGILPQVRHRRKHKKPSRRERQRLHAEAIIEAHNTSMIRGAKALR